ncbi:MAG TPA: PilN domain-containing protein [Candidatus Moranbacteria bacterium]|jgi:Tfp pilus assembly protein PilN|nr:hypothetical protein [Candidatus Moranbacteria bacterium]HPX94066.1 PilN domain-containing protein [Candidatus Moranbacteria bacterium]HQB59383.1 PilN domain-containing protein [Candidatus Moranbacteria bacterium]
MKIYLDLLPEQRKQELKRKKIYRKILHEEILFSLPVIVFVIILANVYYVLAIQRNMHATAYLTEQAQDKYKQLEEYETKFKEINTVSRALVNIQSGHLYWTNLLNELSAITPDGVYIIDLSTKNYSVFLMGKAKTRDILIDFKNQLEKSECFEKVDVPLSNLVVKENVDFQIDLTLKDDCLKSKKQ